LDKAVPEVAPSTSYALHARVLGGAFYEQPWQSTAAASYTSRPKEEEALDKTHFRTHGAAPRDTCAADATRVTDTLDQIGRHAEAAIKFAALMKDSAAKKGG
jgi:hypothetical protein